MDWVKIWCDQIFLWPVMGLTPSMTSLVALIVNLSWKRGTHWKNDWREKKAQCESCQSMMRKGILRAGGTTTILIGPLKLWCHSSICYRQFLATSTHTWKWRPRVQKSTARNYFLPPQKRAKRTIKFYRLLTIISQPSCDRVSLELMHQRSNKARKAQHRSRFKEFDI